MQASYRLNANELNISFLNAIKEMFQDRDIDIFIAEKGEFSDESMEEYEDYQNSKQFLVDQNTLAKRLSDYKTNGLKNFTLLDDTFWEETEKRLLSKNQKAI
jgi:hypothetical protein